MVLRGSNGLLIVPLVVLSERFPGSGGKRVGSVLTLKRLTVGDCLITKTMVFGREVGHRAGGTRIELTDESSIMLLDMGDCRGRLASVCSRDDLFSIGNRAVVTNIDLRESIFNFDRFRSKGRNWVDPSIDGVPEKADGTLTDG